MFPRSFDPRITQISKMLHGAVHLPISPPQALLAYGNYDAFALLVRSIENSDGVLIFDDTIQEKAWTDENELMCWHYDHVSGRNVRGINLLNALYHANGTSIPVAFELVKKPIQYCDLATRQLKRRSEVTKNELMREMIDTCIRNELKFRFVLMDSWFSATENFEFITGKASRLLLSVLHNALEASVLR